MIDKNEFAVLVRDYTRLRKADAGNKEDQAAFGKVQTKLDTFYWQLVQTVVPNPKRIRGDRLFFEKEERILIDTGFLNPHLVDGDSNALKAKLLDELYTSGVKENHFYFTEWLSDRFRQWSAERALKKDQDRKDGLDGDIGKADGELQKLKTLQKTIYKSLAPLFYGLPGVSKDVADLITTGKLKDNVDQITLRYLDTRDKAVLKQREMLSELHRRVMAGVRARTNDVKHLKLIDALGAMEQPILIKLQDLYNSKKKAATGDSGNGGAAKKSASGPSEADQKAMHDFLFGELNLVKNLINLGTLKSGLRRTHSVLAADGERIMKGDVGRIAQKVWEYDRASLSHLTIVIVPFKGSGFFEWDRNCLIVPLTPSIDKEEAIVNAVSSYRMLIDMQQSAGLLKRRYNEAFPSENFNSGFTRDYKNWILKIGGGWRGGLGGGTYQFFKKFVGPDPAAIIAPRELLQLSPEEQSDLLKTCRKAVNGGEAGFQDYYRLAILYWMKDDLIRAAEAMKEAINRDPKHKGALFSLGVIQLQMKQRDRAKETLEEVVNTAANSLWQVYSWEILNEKI